LATGLYHTTRQLLQGGEGMIAVRRWKMWVGYSRHSQSIDPVSEYSECPLTYGGEFIDEYLGRVGIPYVIKKAPITLLTVQHRDPPLEFTDFFFQWEAMKMLYSLHLGHGTRASSHLSQVTKRRYQLKVDLSVDHVEQFTLK
jgi:hypothetical protein